MSEDINQMTETSVSTWGWELSQRNVRGARVAVWLVLVLYPLFGFLDFLMAPSSALGYLICSRILVVTVSLLMLGLLRGPVFLKAPHLLSSGYMYLVGLGISFMVGCMGGLSSPYYAGLNLVMLGCGLLFVWPAQVCYTLHSLTFLSWLIPNLLWSEVGDPIIATSNGFFLFATASIVTVGQIFNYDRLYAQFETQRELVDAQQDLIVAHQKMQQLDAFKSRFFANITHELKTPLALILSSLELLLKGELGYHLNEQKLPIGQMQKHGIKLLKLINDLLDLTKLEESRLRLNLRHMSITRWTSSLVNEIKPLAERKGITVNFDSEIPKSKLWFDPERLERVVVNLLSNATKFTPSGGKIEIMIKAHHDDILLSVRDTGQGFTPDQAEKIFGRFYQTDMGANRKFGGTGIGLALCQELIELHGGEIWATGEEGVGAEFSITLKSGQGHFDSERVTFVDIEDSETPIPVDTNDLTTAVELSSDRELRFVELEEASERRVIERDPDEDERPATVLIAEDNPDITKLLHLALRKHFKVVAASNGIQALELVDRFQPQLIITDLMMPEMDGMELTKRLRTHPDHQSIPILMLSARDGIEEEMREAGYPADEYMAKPFSTRKLGKRAVQLALEAKLEVA